MLMIRLNLNDVSNVTIANEDEQIKANKKWQESLNELEKGNKVVYKGQKCTKESFDKIRKMALEGQNLKVQSKETYIAQVWGSKS